MLKIERTWIDVHNYSIAIRHAGSSERPAFVFLHGWPESSRSFEPLMHLLAADYFVLALDFPGIGGSKGAPHEGDKSGLAGIVHEVIAACAAQSVILVGHDCGGMVVFSYLRKFGSELHGAAILNTVIPGVSPWEAVLANPHVWHFAFHSIPKLPETVVAGHQRSYFNYFLDILSKDKSAIEPQLREEFAGDYATPNALTAGFNWYRSMSDDARLNAVKILIDTPTLYVRGDHEMGDINEYVRGLQATGLQNVSSEIVNSCGHFSPIEAPGSLAKILRTFREDCDRDRSGEVPFFRAHAEPAVLRERH